MFGPTDPDVWAPRNKNVQILRTQSGKLRDLGIEPVKIAVEAAVSAATI
jgi:hypothetical protein